MTLRGNRGQPVAAWQPLRGASVGWECERQREAEKKQLLAAIRAALLNFWPLVKSRKRVENQRRDASKPHVSLLSHANMLLEEGGGRVA